MADNTNHRDNLDYIQELLSPYLDGEVTDEERVLVEQAIAVSPELQQELESLRQTVAMVNALPPMPAPRPFTLSEADVRSVAPALKKPFWRSGWASGLALLATALVCVLIAGGVFLSTQSGQEILAPAEVARLEEGAASQALESEADVAATEPAAEEPVEEAKVEEAEAAPAKEAAPADSVAEKAAPVTEEEEVFVDEGADDAASVAGQTEIAESQGEAQGEADIAATGTSEPTEGAPLATAMPSPQPALPTASPPSESAAAGAVEEEALAEAEEPAAAEPAPAAGVAAESAEEEARVGTEEAAQPPAPEPQDEQNQRFRPENARPVEIQNQQLRVQPGLIQIEGVIEAPPGTILVASLQRNQLPFDAWADPPSLQSIVQPDGRFAFTIRSKAGRADADLFAIEPANYQITIVSVGRDKPVVATVFFETPGPAPERTVAPPTSTPAPAPSHTPTPQPTITPLATPTPAPQATSAPASGIAIQNSLRGLILGAILILAAAVLVIVGIVIWFNINKKS